MASTRAVRPALQRALQQTCSSALLPRPAILPPPTTPMTLLTQPTRLASSSSRASPNKNLTPTTSENPQGSRSKGPAPRKRPARDLNKQRGLSVMRRTGPRQWLSVQGDALPRPVSAADFPVARTDPAHGLWDFFHARDKPLNTPDEDAAHGRAWRAEELRAKGWEDLHRLWWVCAKERNRIATGNWERAKGKYGYGDVESKAREMEVRKTQNAIKHVLTERYYAWEDARKMVDNDPRYEIAEGRVTYKKRQFEELYAAEEEEERPRQLTSSF